MKLCMHGQNGIRRLLPAIGLLAAGASGGAAEAQDRQTIVKNGSVAAKAGPAEYFTGRVAVRRLTDPTAPGQAGTALVTFEPGARSNWHTHPAGQTLYVVDGCGWTQREGGPVTRICKGDTVYVQPGVRHWHGATATTEMTHFTVSEMHDGANVSWMEPVTVEQFRGPTR